MAPSPPERLRIAWSLLLALRAAADGELARTVHRHPPGPVVSPSACRRLPLRHLMAPDGTSLRYQ